MMKKRIISIILALAVILCAFPFGCFSAFAESNGTYIERQWDGSKVTETEHEIPTDATEITGSTSTIGDGKWYVVSSNVTASSRITVSGTANLILLDGYTLTADKGIDLPEGNTLNVYGQKLNSGTLDATVVYFSNTGIGSNDENGGTLTVHGGTVTAKGASGWAAIGGGTNRTGGAVTVLGGTVTATGGMGAAGIGGSSGGSGGDVTVYGGTVSAQGGNAGAGIGGGNKGGKGGTVTVWGGTVTATGGQNAAGIGGGTVSSDGIVGNGGTVTVWGGTVNAQGGNAGAGIGGGNQGNGGDVYIHGGTVTANGGSTAEGIGHGGGAQNSGNREIDASAVIKAGDNEGGAGEVDAYTGQHYAQIHFHNYIDWVCTSCSEHAKYIERKWNGSKLTETELDIPTDAIKLENSATYITLYNDKWYVVSSNVTVSRTITIDGTVNIVLLDGYTFTAEEGILLTEGNTLNIYGQKRDSGTLKAIGASGCAGIGSGGIDGNANSGALTVSGGTVSATGGVGAAGIGGGNQYNGGDVTIFGGTVTATGNGGAGIGGGGSGGSSGGKGGNVKIYGGTVNATGNSSGAGIGGGSRGDGGDVTILGGTVTAAGDGIDCMGIGHGSGSKNSGSLEIAPFAVIKAGDNAGNAKKVNTYGEQTYAQIHFHNAETLTSISNTHHICSFCNETEEHTFINCVCVCGEIEEQPQSLGKYIERKWDGSKVTENEKYIPSDAKVITSDTAELNNGWYVLSTKEVWLPDDKTLTVKGDNVNIVLFDGCTLYLHYGIVIESGAVLNVYGQAADSGFIDTTDNENGIQNNGTLNVYGGNISPCGYGISSAGIGGNGDVYIFGGSVDAQGNGNRAGIYADNVYVYGGSVKAQSTGNGAGIHATGVYVYGGKTEAYGTGGGAGIGGSNGQDGGDFYFYGGTVEAYGISGGAGIGAGDGGQTHGAFWIDNEAATTILAGYNMSEKENVTADEYREQRYHYVKISFCREHIDKDGNGWCDLCDELLIEHYTVLDLDTTTLTGNILVNSSLEFHTPLVVLGSATFYLTEDVYVTAYNGIVLNAGNSLTINARVSDLCFVSAMGEYGAAGIGSEYGMSAGKLTVNGGIIRAYGGYGAKGIGGGMYGNDGEFIQNGGDVYSYNGGGLEHEHTFEKDYTFDENHHWKNCTCGHTVVDAFGTHDYEITKEDNLTKYTCKVCGYTKYEQDTDTCTVTFDTQGYGGEVPSQIVKKNSHVTRPTPDPSYENRIFGGWYEDILCIHEWDFDNYVVSDDITLYAKWIPTSCTLRFYLGDENDRRVKPAFSVHYDQELPDIEPPTREGLVFLGYYLVGEMGTPSVQYYDAYGKGVRKWDVETSTASLVAFWASSGSGGHTHTYSDEWSISENHHWHDCTCDSPDCKGYTSDFDVHSFGEGEDKGDVILYTCSVCGYSKTVEKHKIDTESDITPEGIKFYGTSLTLSSDISINFYMLLTDDAAKNSIMSFTVGSRKITATAQYNEKEGKYFFRCPLTSLEIAQTVNAEFIYSDFSIKKDYSVLEYVTTVTEAAEGTYTPELVNLCKKIANYGHFAQVYLASIHKGVIIGEGGYPEMIYFGTPDIDAAKLGLAAYEFTDDCKNDNILGVSRSLNLDDKVGMNFYITVKAGYELTEDMITVSDGKEFALEKTKDNEYRITLKNITAKHFGDSYTLIIDGETITASVLSYANRIVNGGDYTDIAVSSMAALYEYYVAAEEYARSLKSFTVEFDTNGISPVPSQTVKYGGKVTIPSPEPTAEGFLFGGWYADKDFETPWNFDDFTITENTTIYGKWLADDTKIFDVPTFNEAAAPLYDGTEKSVDDPSYWNGYDPDYMTITDFKATKSGKHTATFSLRQDVPSKWSDETTNDKTAEWGIKYAYAAISDGTMTFKTGFETGIGYYSVSDAETTEYIPWYSKRENVSTVVFDESFALYAPKKCDNWFYNFENLTQVIGLEYLDLSAATTTQGMFRGCGRLSRLNSDADGVFDLSALDMSNIETAKDMFYDCDSLHTLIGPGTSKNPSSFSSSGCSLAQFCYDCHNLTVVDFRNCDISNVISFLYAFYGDCKLQTAYFSRGVPGSANNNKCIFTQMFDGGNSGDMALKTVYCEPGADWGQYSTGSAWMFSHCVNLVGGEGTACDGQNNIEANYAKDDRASINSPGYFTSITRDPDTIKEVALSTVGNNGLENYGIYRIINCFDDGELTISGTKVDSDSSCYKLQTAKDIYSTWRAIFDGNTGFVVFESVENPGHYMNFYGGKPEANTPLCDYNHGLDDIGSKWIVMRADGEPRYNILSALDCNLSAHAQNESAPPYLVAYYNDSPNKDNQFWRFERVE